MPQPSEPEKFSIDEIIDRLKNPPDEEPLREGELVTREDGTQAIRVRKRKRRSHQPQRTEFKHRQRVRMIQVSAVLVLLMMAAFAFGSAIIYANSAPFREKTMRMIGASSGALVKLEQFRVNPARAVAGQLILTWPEGNALRELAVRGVSSDISPSSFLGRSLVGEEVTSDQGLLSLAVPQQGEPLRAIPSVEGPKLIHFNRYAIPRLQIRLGDPARPVAWLQDSEGSFEPNNASGRPQLLLNRGNIAFRGWPKIRLDRSHIEFRGSDMDIVGMRLLHESDNRGSMELDGTVSPYATDRPSSLAVRLESFPISGVAGADMERLISGRISTVPEPKSNFLSFTCGSEPETTLSVSFHNTPSWPVEIHGFPFLVNLARLFEDNWFERPAFDLDVTGALLRTDSNVTFKDLNMQNKGRMAVRGRLTITSDHQLSGELRIGIAVAMVETCPNRHLDLMAGPAEEGFRWFDLKIGGTATVPTDDFLQLLEATKSKSGKPDAAAPGVHGFEELTKPE
jgi:hypothetical protein